MEKVALEILHFNILIAPLFESYSSNKDLDFELTLISRDKIEKIGYWRVTLTKYKSVPNQLGIRKNIFSGSYEASKKIKGKTYSKTFKTVKKAVYWRNTFNPFAHESKINKKFIFKDLWNKYEEGYFPQIELSSQGIKRQKIKVFFNELAELNVCKTSKYPV